ncbi:MAG: hypothetical protein ACLP0J_00695 [Solirubrobacteraceae bacterium]
MRRALLVLVLVALVPASWAQAAATAPAVSTTAATNVTVSGATLNGTINPNGQATTYYFQVGTTTAYGLQTTPATAGLGTANVAATAGLTGLVSATTYHYRLVAVNATSTTDGADQTLTTTTPVSRLASVGHTAFVSPAGVGGIFVGCFGQSNCKGSLALSRSGATLGKRGLFGVAADGGGIVHFTLSSVGKKLLRQRHQLRVEVVIAQSGAPYYANHTSAIVTLVPFS